MPGANPQTLGPGHLFVQLRNGIGGIDTQPSYLGTAEVAPIVAARPFKLKVMNDLAGRSAPFQKVGDGETHLYSITLNRFDYAVWNRVRNAFYHAAAITNHGIDDRFTRGSLEMGLADMRLVHVNQFTGLSPAHPLALPEQPVGRMYYSAELVDYHEDTQGTRVMAITAVFECDGLYDPSALRFLHYTEVASNFPSPLTVN